MAEENDAGEAESHLQTQRRRGAAAEASSPAVGSAGGNGAKCDMASDELAGADAVKKEDDVEKVQHDKQVGDVQQDWEECPKTAERASSMEAQSVDAAAAARTAGAAGATILSSLAVALPSAASLRKSIGVSLSALSSTNEDQKSDGESRCEWHMVFEYCDGGDVMDVLVQKERFSEPLAAQVARNLVSAIAFCQEKNIAHRDIKGENVLCFGGQEDESQMRFKLTDFGAATYYGSWDEVHSQKIGSSCYVAPEGKLYLLIS